MRTDYLICYDVNTEDLPGRRRLRHVAKACKAYGQRVQYSVFECTLNEMQYEKLRRRLFDIIDKAADSLRIYRLTGERGWYLEQYGRDLYVDFEEPLVV